MTGARRASESEDVLIRNDAADSNASSPLRRASQPSTVEQDIIETFTPVTLREIGDTTCAEGNDARRTHSPRRTPSVLLRAYVALVRDLWGCVVKKWAPVGAASLCVALGTTRLVRAVSERADWVLPRCSLAASEFIFFVAVVFIIVATTTTSRESKIPPFFIGSFAAGAACASALFAGLISATSFLRGSPCSLSDVWIGSPPVVLLYIIGNLPVLRRRELVPEKLRDAHSAVIACGIVAAACAQAAGLLLFTAVSFFWLYEYSGPQFGGDDTLAFVYGSIVYPVASTLLIYAMLGVTKSGNVEPAFYALQVRIYVYNIKLPERTLQYCNSRPYAGLVTSTFVATVVKEVLPFVVAWAKANLLPRLRALLPSFLNNNVSTRKFALRERDISSTSTATLNEMVDCEGDVDARELVDVDARNRAHEHSIATAEEIASGNSGKAWLSRRKMNELVGRNAANVCGVGMAASVCRIGAERAAVLGVFGVGLMMLADLVSLAIAFGLSRWSLESAVHKRALVEKVGNVRAAVVMCLCAGTAAGILLAARNWCP